MGHLHIFNPKKKPCIRNELNEFLKKHDYSKKSITLILQKIAQYIQYFSHKAHKLIKSSITHIKKRKTQHAINEITQSFPEIEFEIDKIENVYQNKFLNHYDAIHCLPLIHLILNEIIKHIHKQHTL